jgi:hypothetical protein
MKTFEILKKMENQTILEVDSVYQGEYDIYITLSDGTKIEIYGADSIAEFKNKIR